jgi:hypothetical protein
LEAAFFSAAMRRDGVLQQNSSAKNILPLHGEDFRLGNSLAKNILPLLCEDFRFWVLLPRCGEMGYYYKNLDSCEISLELAKNILPLHGEDFRFWVLLPRCGEMGYYYRILLLRTSCHYVARIFVWGSLAAMRRGGEFLFISLTKNILPLRGDGILRFLYNCFKQWSFQHVVER